MLEYMRRLVQKDPLSGTIVYLVREPEKYKHDKQILEYLGFKVYIGKIGKNFAEQLRKADVLADYVFVEKGDGCEVSLREMSLRAYKDLNGYWGDFSCFGDCTGFGMLAYLGEIDFSLFDKNVVILGEDHEFGELIRDVFDANVYYLRRGDKIPHGTDLIVVGRGGKLNCYPVYCKVLRCGGELINTEGRDVVGSETAFRIAGVIEQLW